MRSIVFLSVLILTMCTQNNERNPDATAKTFTLSEEMLKDKIKGGWAGQTIGVTYGGPMEFRFNGTMIQEYVPIQWYDGYLKKTMINNPGLYDDIYMDLTFVDVFEKEGFDAPVSSFANAFANAGYTLWHANQAARYNILHGTAAPQSGHWLSNPHADCIDYQIEADFAGLMSPGMPNAASAISDKVGHIMNFGDGWYGGVYIGALYSLAFIHNDIPFIVEEALKTIPKESDYYKCISDVIAWYKKYPDDWKQTWFEVQKKWSSDIGCPDGVFKPFNIDATINSAYVVIGLLYGGGDFTKTLEIATRCGQDADCNPASAGGILGTLLGYDNIPAYWKQGLSEAESIDFKFTEISLNDVYETGTKHALQNIVKQGGKVENGQITIPLEVPVPVRYEKSFDGHYPVERREIFKALHDEFTFDFEGVGFVITGETAKWNSTSNYVFNVECYLDNELVETSKLSTSYLTRKNELIWKYKLPPGKHEVRLKLLNPDPTLECRLGEIIIYTDKTK